MSSALKSIKKPILKELDQFEKHFRNAMQTDVALLDKITYYIVKRKGKQIRPMFVFLCAKMFGEITEATYVAASQIELLHTATLVHDDVVDDSDKRRGFFSINALWKNKIAVLVGDFLFSKGMLIAIETEQFEIFKTVARAVKEMSEGELLQMDKSRKLDIDEEIYFKIIKQKTATLISSATSTGAFSTSRSVEVMDQMWDFGINLGIAYQIKDDLFDYGTDDIGKPVGIDIKEKKMTLPLIHVMANADRKHKNWLKTIIKKHHEDKSKVIELIQYVKANGGIEYAQNKMMEYKQKAIDIIADVPASESKTALLELVNFIVERKK